MRRIALLTLALTLAACGHASVMDAADVETYDAWSKSYAQVTDDMVELSTALAGRDLSAARKDVIALTPRLKTADRYAAAVGNDEVRELLTGFMVKTHRAVDSLAAVVRELIAEREPGPDVLREMTEANQAMFDADQQLSVRVLDLTPPELRGHVARVVPKR